MKNELIATKINNPWSCSLTEQLTYFNILSFWSMKVNFITIMLCFIILTFKNFLCLKLSNHFHLKNMYVDHSDLRVSLLLCRYTTAITYDNHMSSHFHSWKDDFTEKPERFTETIKRCEKYGLIKRCKYIPVSLFHRS